MRKGLVKRSLSLKNLIYRPRTFKVLPLMPRFFYNFDRLLLFLSISALLFLAFVAGGVSVYYKWPLYGLIHDAHEAEDALKSKEKRLAQAAKEKAIRIKTPVIKIHERGASTGYNLITSDRYSGALLIDMDGHIVHQWRADFSTVWPSPSHVSNPFPDHRIGWSDAYLYPNGDVLGIYEAAGDSPYGYGLVKIDKDSNVLWRYSANVHHRLSVDENGMIYVLIQKSGKTPKLENAHFKSSRIMEDILVVLSPDGKEKRRFPLVGALLRSGYGSLLSGYTQKWLKKGDILHTNYVMPLSAEMAQHFPMFKPGQLLISMRNPNLIGVFDPDKNAFIWMTKGPWKMQHYVSFQSDGTLAMLDNIGARGHSRILRYDPSTKETSSIYGGDKNHRFMTRIRGMYQPLANGNWLITSAQQYRMFEINHRGKIVWEMANPIVKSDNGKAVALITGRRYQAGDLPFLKGNAP